MPNERLCPVCTTTCLGSSRSRPFAYGCHLRHWHSTWEQRTAQNVSHKMGEMLYWYTNMGWKTNSLCPKGKPTFPETSSFSPLWSIYPAFHHGPRSCLGPLRWWKTDKEAAEVSGCFQPRAGQTEGKRMWLQLPLLSAATGPKGMAWSCVRREAAGG